MSIASKLDWHGHEFTLAGFTFHDQNEMATNTASDAFHFFKTQDQVAQLDRFFEETGFAPERVLELGLWDGGSAAFWPEVLDSITAYAGVDILTRGDSDYFATWNAERGSGRVTTHWGVGQTDGPALDRIIADRGLEPLDLILDDCSHQYELSLRSFELLFGRVRPGGWYVIEDWDWALRPSYQRRDHPWALRPALHPLIHELIDLHGSRRDVISGLRVFPEFVAVERGPASLAQIDVSRLIARRKRPWLRVGRHQVRQSLDRFVKRVRP